MGVKSRTRAEKRKESKKDVAFARLRNVPTSPRKMRLVADLVRGKQVEIALQILKTNPKHPSVRLHKLLLSAIANWQNKHEGQRLEESDLFVKEIRVDVGRTLKRIQPAPQGRAHRIRKRSNHVMILLDSKIKPTLDEEKVDEAAQALTEKKSVKKPKSTAKPSSSKRTKAAISDKAKSAPKKEAKPKARIESKKSTTVKQKSKKG